MLTLLSGRNSALQSAKDAITYAFSLPFTAYIHNILYKYVNKCYRCIFYKKNKLHIPIIQVQLQKSTIF